MFEKRQGADVQFIDEISKNLPNFDSKTHDTKYIHDRFV